MPAYQEWASADVTASTLKNPSGAAALCYPAGATTLTSDDLIIPMRITSYQGVSRSRTASSRQTIGRLTVSTNSSSGGNLAAMGKMTLATIALQGELDSPTKTAEIFSTPSIVYPTNSSNSYTVSYADIIAACLEGRVYELGNPSYYGVVHPNWFRDPFGRLFNRVRVRSFSASFTEAAPGRQTFNMVLEV